jgi:aminoglycoside phosphotransferase family enzyme/predicted kinase
MSFPPLIRALLDPSVYDHPTWSICCRETHISWIILTGLYAYKLKKPVDLGFLDFSTLDKRRFYCQEELRLNRRLAPQLYLEVVAITGTPTSPSLKGEGPILEYAVKMRQFRQEDLLAERAARGELEEAHLSSLAELIARFHQSAAQARPQDPYGDPDLIHAAARQNFAQIERDLTVLNALQAWSESEFEKRREDMAERKRQGYIRECHGDLHLGNIVLWQGQPLPFDCIEFNPALRWIDLCSEIAFTVMDLCARGFKALGFGFLNDYLSLTGDYASVKLFSYYLVYRAMVRAKIAHLSWRQHPELPSLEDFERYLKLAGDFSRPRPVFLCITHGFSGSGKSFISRRLAAQLGALHLRSDVERKRLAGLAAVAPSKSSLGGGIYRQDFTQRTYQKLLENAYTILTSGYPAIVDATFLTQAWRLKFKDLAQSLKLPFLILNFSAPEEVLRQRILKRRQERRDPSEADLKVLEYQLCHHEPLDSSEQALTLTLDTTAEDGERMLRALQVRLGLK